MAEVEEPDLKGKVERVRKEWSVHEDGALAHKLQEEEIGQHYSGNVQRRQTVRKDIVTAKTVAGDEVLEAFEEEKEQARRQAEIEEMDRKAAEELYQQLLAEERSVYERQKSQEDADAAYARHLQEKEQRKFERHQLKKRERELRRERAQLEKIMAEHDHAITKYEMKAAKGDGFDDDDELTNAVAAMRIDKTKSQGDYPPDQLPPEGYDEDFIQNNADKRLSDELPRYEGKEGEDEIEDEETRQLRQLHDDEEFAKLLVEQERKRKGKQRHKDISELTAHDAEIARKMQQEEELMAKRHQYKRHQKKVSAEIADLDPMVPLREDFPRQQSVPAKIKYGEGITLTSYKHSTKRQSKTPWKPTNIITQSCNMAEPYEYTLSSSFCPRPAYTPPTPPTQTYLILTQQDFTGHLQDSPAKDTYCALTLLPDQTHSDPDLIANQPLDNDHMTSDTASSTSLSTCCKSEQSSLNDVTNAECTLIPASDVSSEITRTSRTDSSSCLSSDTAHKNSKNSVNSNDKDRLSESSESGKISDSDSGSRDRIWNCRSEQKITMITPTKSTLEERVEQSITSGFSPQTNISVSDSPKTKLPKKSYGEFWICEEEQYVFKRTSSFTEKLKRVMKPTRKYSSSQNLRNPSETSVVVHSQSHFQMKPSPSKDKKGVTKSEQTCRLQESVVAETSTGISLTEVCVSEPWAKKSDTGCGVVLCQTSRLAQADSSSTPTVPDVSETDEQSPGHKVDNCTADLPQSTARSQEISNTDVDSFVEEQNISRDIVPCHQLVPSLQIQESNDENQDIIYSPLRESSDDLPSSSCSESIDQNSVLSDHFSFPEDGSVSSCQSDSIQRAILNLDEESADEEGTISRERSHMNASSSEESSDCERTLENKNHCTTQQNKTDDSKIFVKSRRRQLSFDSGVSCISSAVDQNSENVSSFGSCKNSEKTTSGICQSEVKGEVDNTGGPEHESCTDNAINDQTQDLDHEFSSSDEDVVVGGDDHVELSDCASCETSDSEEFGLPTYTRASVTQNAPWAPNCIMLTQEHFLQKAPDTEAENHVVLDSDAEISVEKNLECVQATGDADSNIAKETDKVDYSDTELNLISEKNGSKLDSENAGKQIVQCSSSSPESEQIIEHSSASVEHRTSVLPLDTGQPSQETGTEQSESVEVQSNSVSASQDICDAQESTVCKDQMFNSRVKEKEHNMLNEDNLHTKDKTTFTEKPESKISDFQQKDGDTSKMTPQTSNSGHVNHRKHSLDKLPEDAATLDPFSVQLNKDLHSPDYSTKHDGQFNKEGRCLDNSGDNEPSKDCKIVDCSSKHDNVSSRHDNAKGMRGVPVEHAASPGFRGRSQSVGVRLSVISVEGKSSAASMSSSSSIGNLRGDKDSDLKSSKARTAVTFAGQSKQSESAKGENKVGASTQGEEALHQGKDSKTGRSVQSADSKCRSMSNLAKLAPVIENEGLMLEQLGGKGHRSATSVNQAPDAVRLRPRPIARNQQWRHSSYHCGSPQYADPWVRREGAESPGTTPVKDGKVNAGILRHADRGVAVGARRDPRRPMSVAYPPKVTWDTVADSLESSSYLGFRKRLASDSRIIRNAIHGNREPTSPDRYPNKQGDTHRHHHRRDHRHGDQQQLAGFRDSTHSSTTTPHAHSSKTSGDQGISRASRRHGDGDDRRSRHSAHHSHHPSSLPSSQEETARDKRHHSLPAGSQPPPSSGTHNNHHSPPPQQGSSHRSSMPPPPPSSSSSSFTPPSAGQTIDIAATLDPTYRPDPNTGNVPAYQPPEDVEGITLLKKTPLNETLPPPPVADDREDEPEATDPNLTPVQGTRRKSDSKKEKKNSKGLFGKLKKKK